MERKITKLAGRSGFTGSAIDGVVLRPQVEQLVEKSEIDAEVIEHGPGDERGGGENQFVVGREDRGQKIARRPVRPSIAPLKTWRSRLLIS